MPALQEPQPGAPGGRTEPFVGQKGASVPNGTSKVTVYELATRKAYDVWPVDARELIASGEYSWTPAPEPTPGDSPADSPADPPASESPAPPAPEPAPGDPPAAPRRLPRNGR